MGFLNKSMRVGSFWTICYFVCSFGKTIVLTPLMLTHWGKEVFCFWALLLSCRSLLGFLSDSFIRYISNLYNIRYHLSPFSAQTVLQAGMGFLSVFGMSLTGLMFLVFNYATPVTAWVFSTNLEGVKAADLGWCLSVYMLAAMVQQVQRMYACVKEARGLIAHNLAVEVILVLAEVGVLSGLLLQDDDFYTCVMADSALIITTASIYIYYLSATHPVPSVLTRRSLRRGWQHFRKAGKLYTGNFLEKLSSDGLLLLLAVLRIDKTSLAVFATVRTIVNTPLLADNLLMNAYTPEMQRHYALKDSKAMAGLLRYTRLAVGGILLTGIVLAWPLYGWLFRTWTRHQLPYDALFMMLMLVTGIFNMYGIGYSFVLKGINAMNQMMYAMLLKCILMLAGLWFLANNLPQVAVILALTECCIAMLCFPALLHRQWKKAGLDLSLRDDLRALLPYLFSVLCLVLLYAWDGPFWLYLAYPAGMAALLWPVLRRSPAQIA
jgi:O-antigen/teichoic acid export membrane protein